MKYKKYNPDPQSWIDEPEIMAKKLTTTDLFKKHFGNVPAVNLSHPNIENFFEELNTECLNEDKKRDEDDEPDYDHTEEEFIEKHGIRADKNNFY